MAGERTTRQSTSNVPQNMCRACLATEGTFQSIFVRSEAIDININLAEIIMEYSSVQIAIGDGLPEVICLICAKKCTELYRFKTTCETSDLTLRQLFCHIIKPPQLNTDMKAEPKDLNLEDIKDNLRSRTYKDIAKVDKVKMEPGEIESLGVEAIFSDDSNDSILDSIPLKLIVNKNETKKHKCDNCNMRFRKMYHLKRHLKAYSVDGVFTCHPSKKVTPQDFNLSECDKAEITEKMKLKNKKYKHECSICKKRFMKPSHLNRHAKVHSAVRNHICTKCKKTFVKLEQLNTHMNIHNGIKPHVCKICSKGFNQTCTLKDHMRTHSGEKPFLCTTCGKGFNQSSNLRQHMQLHTGIKAHLCSECGTGFVSKGKLTVHMRTHTEIREITENTARELLPTQSRQDYEKQFQIFDEWCNKNNIKTITENVLLAYFDIQRTKYKPTTLWTTYSMLRSCLHTYKDVDISKFNKLQALLKRLSEGYAPKKSNILEEEDINTFIREADDKMYLAMKVVLIMGYNGACRREELTNMCIDHIEYNCDSIIVTVPKTKNNVPRMFAITNQKWIDLIQKYGNLRPKTVTHNRFFLTYRNGYCLKSPIGINIMGKVSKYIASFLKLPNPEFFTGHCFRRSSAKHLANRGGNLWTIKRRGGWKSSAVAKDYVETSLENKIEISQMLWSPQHHNLNLPGCSSATQFPLD